MTDDQTGPLLAKEGSEESSLDYDGAYGAMDLTVGVKPYQDELEYMSLSRRAAMYLSDNFAWYDPNGRAALRKRGGEEDGDGADAPPRPSLDLAWQSFEHITLPRHLEGRMRGKGKQRYPRARVGERKKATRLYPVWKTHEVDLGDFGEGIGLYFFTLRALSVVLLVAGVLNIPNIWYFGSNEYNDSKGEGIHLVLRGTAICPDQRWAPCPSCTKDQWDYFPQAFDRYAESVIGTLTYIKVNDCTLTYWNGLVQLLSILFVFSCITVLCFRILPRISVAMDEAMLSTKDYSIQVANPPKDARDAEEWKEFFSQFDHVTSVTVAVDNEELVKALVARRLLLVKLSMLLPAGAEFDKLNLGDAVERAMPQTKFQKLMRVSDAAAMHDQIGKIDEKIKRMTSERDQYDVTEIFVIFETEEAQQRVLSELSVPWWGILSKGASALPKELRFRGDLRLSVHQSVEPSAVRWDDLGQTFSTFLYQRALTFTLTASFIFGGCFFIKYCRIRYSSAMSALAISIMNTLAPYVCYYVTELESHHSEGSKQASRYYKITASLWAFTALITSWITPFTDTISNSPASIIHSVYAIFIFEMLRGPITQLLDVSSNMYRHIMAPRAVDQQRMNLCFQGTAYELSERYTNMTNVLFTTFYYSTIFPSSFFFAAATLFVHYWTDKFCLLRTWSRAPRLGTQVFDISRAFIMFTVIIFAIISSYNMSSFPFDNACEDITVAGSEYIGNHTVMTGNGMKVEMTTIEGEKNYFYCNQDMLRYNPPAFPAVPSNQPEGGEWMGEAQESITRLYGWACTIVVCVVAAMLFGKIVLYLFRSCFFSSFEPEAKAGGLKFSDPRTDTFGYVPQVKVFGLPYPFLVSDVSDISTEIMGWHDPKLGYEGNTVSYDLPILNKKGHLFSSISHWPPAVNESDHQK